MNKIVFIIFTVLVAACWFIPAVANTDSSKTEDLNSVRVELLYPSDESQQILGYKNFRKEELTDALDLTFINFCRDLGDPCIDAYKGKSNDFKVKISFVLNELTFLELMKITLDREVSFEDIPKFERFLDDMYFKYTNRYE